MYGEFAPILMLLVFWIVIGVPIVIAKKAAEQKKPARPNATKPPAPVIDAREQRQPEPERLKALTPSIFVTDHDDSVYRGSMNAVTGEGYDPCHEEQLAVLDRAETMAPAPRPQQAHAGIPLGWTDNDVVRGIVMSEILNRKHR